MGSSPCESQGAIVLRAFPVWELGGAAVLKNVETRQESPMAVELPESVMAWFKGKDLRLHYWVAWTVLVLGFIAYGYFEFLVPQNCDNIQCAVDYFRPDVSPKPADPFVPLYNDTRRIAVCLVGGARMFEITGRTIRKHLLDVYNNTDVFVHSPLDMDSHKLTLLAGRNLRAAKIFIPTPQAETTIVNEVITSWGSPHGLQGLLQYFNLVEGCYGMVKQYEVQYRFKYDWIIRTRVDGYWSGPVPDIAQLDPNYYYVAAGSDFHGLNDRFGMGNPHTSGAANARLTLLPLMHQRGLRKLNSESAYKAQLDISGVPYKRIQVPFCVMTLRQEAYPKPAWGLLVLSMASRGPMSGTYCRPCDKEENATVSEQVVNGCMRDWDWPGVAAREVTVCDPRKPWSTEWRKIAAESYSIDVPGEEIPSLSSRSVLQCIAEMQDFQRQWDVWESPPIEQICAQAYRER
nr:uncharacterized protein LOC112294907 isoform X2 [Physcomitrium patens]|eukprot:XP_024401670.1 uncharacterized protein LOC112294907 isoform X2 [Physcomitrella patens]